MKRLAITAVVCACVAAWVGVSDMQRAYAAEQPKVTTPEEEMASDQYYSLLRAIEEMEKRKMMMPYMIQDLEGQNTFNWNGRPISQDEFLYKANMWKEWLPRLEAAKTDLRFKWTEYSNDRPNEQKKTELQKSELEVKALLEEFNRLAN